MKERPILFKAEMVRAILEGRKTQTRRAAKLPADAAGVVVDPGGTIFGPGPYLKIFRMDGCEPPMYPRSYCPYGYPGDRLWVKEAWDYFGGNEYLYQQDAGSVLYRERDENSPGHGQRRWRSPLFMPRWASRITLEITEVRVQQLHEISDDDARSEGVVSGVIPASGDHPSLIGYVLGRDDGRCVLHPTEREAFSAGWDTIKGKRIPWSSNPWVWAITFRRVER